MKSPLLFLFVCLCTFAAAKAQTNVSGGIYSNTTWTLANSPYIVTDTVVVFPGVTLTIEPGVVVKFDNNIRLEIRQATLIAQGTITDSITFTSNATTPALGDWSGIFLNYDPIIMTFNYCNFKYASSAIIKDISGASIYINHSNFDSNGSGIGIAPPANNVNQVYIDSSNFINNIYGTEFLWQGKISNCYFLNNFMGTYEGQSDIDNCIFKYNNHGIFSGGDGQHIKDCIIDSNTTNGLILQTGNVGDSIINCHIGGNGIGLRDSSLMTSWVITKNVIENNSIGIQLSGLNGCVNTIICNKICNNSLYDLKYIGSINVDLSNNYWCTPDSASTEAVIYDGYDNINYGLIHFMPLDTQQCYLSGCALAVSTTVSNATCDTCHNGYAIGHAIHGLQPFTWTWYTFPIQTTQVAVGLAPGFYTLCVTDANGCVACDSTIFIDSTNCTGYSIQAYASNATCSSCNDGKAWVNVTGGTPPYAYTWYTIPMQSTDTASGLTHGTYHVCVTDLYGCTVCDSATVSTGNCSAYFYLYPDSVTLHNYYAVNMASGILPISYYWDWGDGTHDTTAYPSHTYATAGFYTICLTITDSAGCSSIHCDSFYLQKNTNTMITVNVIPNTVTGISGYYGNEALNLFPNPVTDILFINAPLKSDIEIYSSEGQKIKSLHCNNAIETIDMRSVPSGVYIVKVKTEKEIVVRKIIKE